MARITAGITTSHVPAVGAAVDMGAFEAPLSPGIVILVR